MWHNVLCTALLITYLYFLYWFPMYVPLRMYCQMYLNSMHACKSQFCKCSQLYCHYLYSSLLCNNTDRYLRQLRMPHGGSGGIMTANIPITPPEQFDFKKPDEWLKWKRRFTQFLSASGLDKEDEARQVSTLIAWATRPTMFLPRRASPTRIGRNTPKSWKSSTNTSMSEKT